MRSIYPTSCSLFVQLADNSFVNKKVSLTVKKVLLIETLGESGPNRRDHFLLGFGLCGGRSVTWTVVLFSG